MVGWWNRAIVCALAVGLLSACGKVSKNDGGNPGGPSDAGASGMPSSAGTGGASSSTGAGPASAGTVGVAGSGSGGIGNAGFAGISGSSGLAGSAGFVTQGNADKLDLLLMIDNSTSMADKQQLLAEAIPSMVKRFVTPLCIDPISGDPVGAVNASGTCDQGMPELQPLKDIHVAIVSSSLGSHGGNVCDGAVNANDNGQTIGSMRGIAGWNNTGFLAWDPSGTRDTPPGETNSAAFTSDLTQMLAATGETGCGYEASLEAWYRFLIDPEPPLEVVHDTTTNLTVKQGINQTLLAQRSAFLRPNSVVAIVMLSDEDDCSIEDAGYGWFLSTRTLPNGQENRMYRATSACDSNPNSPCCMSCGDSSAPPAGCGFTSTSSDPNCASPFYQPNQDTVSLRCWDTKRRFGFDLLYPTSRYSSALTSQTICPDSTSYLAGGCPAGQAVVNPLYDPLIQTKNGANGPPATGTRDTSLVFLSAIVGVPWQDLATDDSFTNPNRLSYLTSTEMNSATPNRWSLVLGDPTNPAGPIPPADPFMIPTYIDRTTLPIPQSNPIVPTEKLQPSSSTNPQANHINGHEQNVPGFDDLQYACIFPLPAPKVCANGMQACDCSPTASGDLTPVQQENSPLCNPPGTATQTYAKAYPGLRHLKVLHDFGAHAIPASICPKIMDTAQPDYGLVPALDAVVDSVKVGLGHP